MTYDMEEFLDSCVQKYVDLAGPGTKVKEYATPFISEDHRASPAGAPGTGPCVECPWCKHTFAAKVWKDVGELEVSKYKKRPRDASQPGEPGGQSPPHHADRGRLQPIASRVLMKILWAARLARFDLLRAVTHLATYVKR